MNFARVTSAEGRAAYMDDDEERHSKMDAVTCSLKNSDIQGLLEAAQTQLNHQCNAAKGSGTQPERRNRRLYEATVTAVSAMRLQLNHAERDSERKRAVAHCRPMHSETKKAVVDEAERLAHLASVQTYMSDYRSDGKLGCDGLKQIQVSSQPCSNGP